MGAILNPKAKYGSAVQAGLYYARRRRLANQILAGLAVWAEGLTITQGQFVQSDGFAYSANAGGTTAGSVTPTGANFNDGGVTWTRVDTMSLLQYLYTGAPTP